MQTHANFSIRKKKGHSWVTFFYICKCQSLIVNIQKYYDPKSTLERPWQTFKPATIPAEQTTPETLKYNQYLNERMEI